MNENDRKQKQKKENMNDREKEVKRGNKMTLNKSFFINVS